MDDLKETVQLVEQLDRRIRSFEVDVRNSAELRTAVNDGVGELGRLDIVVANAGIHSLNVLWEITDEQWNEVVGTNLTGVFYTLRATVPILIEQGTGGSIVITSSVAGLRGLPFMAHYAASKHGVVGLCRSLANELGQYDIRVNTVHPNGVDTPMGHDAGDFGERIAANPSLGPIFMNALPYEMVPPEAIADVVAFLASDEGRYITGAQLPVDLGTLVR